MHLPGLFHSFVFRLPSLLQLETELSHTYTQGWIGAERAFRDDTLRYSLCSFDLQPGECMLVDVNLHLKRNKAFDQGRVQGHLVAAVDGIVQLQPLLRQLPGAPCDLKREWSQGRADQYYHRAVGCQMVHSPVKAFLAIEWQRPGEGEDTAALRLLRCLPRPVR